MEILGVAVEMCPYLENFDVEMVLNSTEPNSFTSLIMDSMYVWNKKISVVQTDLRIPILWVVPEYWYFDGAVFFCVVKLYLLYPN